MSDRRERVAKAISDALPGYMHARGVLDPTGKVPHWWPNGEGTLALADAALAVIDAEPTEAEIDAAETAFWFGGGASPREDMRVALIAARKARKEAGK